MNHVVNNFAVSQRWASALLEEHPSTQRLSPTGTSDYELTLRARLRGLANTRPSYGYRRLHTLLVREGFRIYPKQMQRLCRDEGLRLSVKKRARSQIGQSTIFSIRLSARIM